MKKALLAVLLSVMTTAASAWTLPINIENNTYIVNNITILNMYISADDKTWSSAIPVNLPGYAPGTQPTYKTVNVPYQIGGPCFLFLAFTFMNHSGLVWPHKLGQPIFDVCRDHTIKVEFLGDQAGPTIPLILVFE